MALGDKYPVVYVDGDVPQRPLQLGQLLVDSSQISPGTTNLQQCTSQNPVTYEPIQGGYPRNAEEILAGVVPVTDLYPWGHWRRYGMVSDWNGVVGPGATGTDNAAAFRNLMLVAAQGISPIFESGKFRILVGGADSNLSAIQDLDGIAIYSNGASFYFEGTYVGSQYIEVFSFRDCNNVSLIGSISGAQYPIHNGGNDLGGIELFKFWDGCTNVTTGPIYGKNLRAAVYWRRNSTSDPKGGGYVHQLIRTEDCAYTLAQTLNGDDGRSMLVTERAVRSYYPYGVKNGEHIVVSKDHDSNADVNISSAGGEGCQGIEVWYHNTESTVADNTRNCVKVSFTDQTATLHSDIKIHLDIQGSASSYLGFGFELEKLDNGGSPDTTARGHILQTLVVDGHITAGNGNQRSLGVVGQFANGATPDEQRDVKYSVLLSGTSQPTLDFSQLQDAGLVEKFTSTSQVNVTGTAVAGARVDVVNANVSAWAVTGGQIYLQDEKETTVAYSASMTFSAFDGSTFVITATNATPFTINAPTNAAKGKQITVRLRNTSGGALGAATWAAVFKLAAWVNPANGNSRSIVFEYDGTNWVEISRTPADVPN